MGVIPTTYEWAEGIVILRAMFFYDVEIRFARETWRGRFRVCRGVGVGFSLQELEDFDNEHDDLLKQIVSDGSTITHRIDAQFLALRDTRKSSIKAPKVLNYLSFYD
ncbi:MAG: hypothetical protein KBD78_15045 [Oligoflexales bacterium]|nr:hypothetical protein [Oligoflexales bacterium]